MFSPDHLIKQLGLTQTYRQIKWMNPPCMPKVIEFLDCQEALVSGVLYISPEEYVSEYFNRCSVKVFPGAALLVSNASNTPPQLPDYAADLTIIGFSESAGRLYNRLANYTEAPTERSNSPRFNEIWGKIMSDRTLTTSEIRDDLRKLPGLDEPFVQIVVAVFYQSDNVKIPYSRIMHQLKALIPNCCATVYDKEIVLLTTYKERRFTFPFEFEQLNAVLEPYNGYMGISNGTRQLESIRALYQLTRRIVTLAHEMEISCPGRVYTFERLGTYMAIDLCAKGFYEFVGDKGLLYLAHPAVIALARYDDENNDNLREVLYFYLFNDRSVALTANALYMHRNTVLNKIRKINQLLKLDLEDRHLRQRLLFSCQLIHYYEDINHGDIDNS